MNEGVILDGVRKIGKSVKSKLIVPSLRIQWRQNDEIRTWHKVSSRWFGWDDILYLFCWLRSEQIEEGQIEEDNGTLLATSMSYLTMDLANPHSFLMKSPKWSLLRNTSYESKTKLVTIRTLKWNAKFSIRRDTNRVVD